MIEVHIRHKIQPLFNHFCLYLIPYCAANAITILGLFIGALSGLALAFSYSSSALILLWISGICDVFDGTLARLTNTSQKLGTYLDLVADRLVESALIVGFAVRQPEYMWSYLFFLIVLLFHFSTFVTAGALFENTGHKSMHYETSIIERAEAFIIFSLIICFPTLTNKLFMMLNCLIACDAALRFYRIVKSENKRNVI